MIGYQGQPVFAVAPEREEHHASRHEAGLIYLLAENLTRFELRV